MQKNIYKICSLVLIFANIFQLISYANNNFIEDNIVQEVRIYEEKIDEEKINEKYITQNLIQQDKKYGYKVNEDLIAEAYLIEIKVSKDSENEIKALLPENFDDEKIDWKKVISRFAIGTSIIIAVGVVNYATKGASTFFFFASPVKVARDAFVGGAIGAVINTTINTTNKGKVTAKSVKKYAIEGFAEGYMWGAIYSVLGTAVGNLKKLKAFKLAMGGSASIKVDGTVIDKAGKILGKAYYNEKDKIWYLLNEKTRTITNVFDLKGKEIAKAIKLTANAKINLASDVSSLTAYTDDLGQVFRASDNLVPNSKYTIKGYEYFTDNKGRIKKVVFDKLKLKPKRPRLEIVDKMDAIGKGFQKATDDRGHLIADMFDGDSSLANIVPMDKNVNQNIVKVIEEIWQETLENGGKVKGSIDISYSASSFRPTKFTYKYICNNAKEVVKNIIN